MATELDLNNKKLCHLIAACSFGTILEWYDFTLYAYLTPIISSLFFPSANAIISIMLAYAVFAIGFVVRPLGAILFGHFGDRLGRKKVLLSTIILMATTTCLIGALPTYATIGIGAPVLLLFFRILQGLSVGGETMGAAAFVIESAPHHRRGLTTSIVWASSGIGILLSSIAVTALHWHFSDQQILTGGWRLPFILGAVTGILGFYLRRNTIEPVSFQSIQCQQMIEKFPLMRVFKNYKTPLFITIKLYVLSAIITYLIFVYMPVYASKIIGLAFKQTMSINTIMMLFMILLVPVAGYMADVVGRKIILLVSSIGLMILAFPMYYLIAHYGYIGLVVAQVVFAVFAACFQGTVTSAVLEMFPMPVRYSAAAFGYNLSYSLLGGTTPLIAMYLVNVFNNNTALSLYLIAGSVVGMIAAINMPQTDNLTLA